MANLGTNFYPKLVQISSELGMKPEDLLVVMISESGLNPAAVEHTYKGSGLVGFMPDTLKGLGFKGTWEDFTKLTGEQQLDYVKKLVANYTQLNGSPLTSAGQYYTANLWPIALKLSGVKNGDPNTPIIEANPEKAGPNNQYSKKYYDLGYKINANFESQAYKANPLFDKDHKGAITYGDMIKQAEKMRDSSIYQKAISDMEKTSGYKVKIEKPIMVQQDKSTPNSLNDIDGIQTILSKFISVLSENQLSINFHKKAQYQKHLLEHKFLIKIQSNTNNIDAIEFSRILCTALDEELMADSSIHTDNYNTEIECYINGPKFACEKSILYICSHISNLFEKATKNIGGIKISSIIIPNKSSNYQELNIKLAMLNYSLFHQKFLKEPNV